MCVFCCCKGKVYKVVVNFGCLKEGGKDDK